MPSHWHATLPPLAMSPWREQNTPMTPDTHAQLQTMSAGSCCSRVA